MLGQLAAEVSSNCHARAICKSVPDQNSHPPSNYTPYPVQRSSGGLQSSSNPSNTLLSASSIVSGLPRPPSSRSTQLYGASRDLIPLLSNFRFFSYLQYRLRSRWNVVSDVHPSTAQPTVLHGLMRMSTLRWGFGFLSEDPSGLESGSCQTTSALSRVSKPVPPLDEGLKLVGCWPRDELWVLRVRVCAGRLSLDLANGVRVYGSHSLMCLLFSRLITSLSMNS